MFSSCQLQNRLLTDAQSLEGLMVTKKGRLGTLLFCCPKPQCLIFLDYDHRAVANGRDVEHWTEVFRNRRGNSPATQLARSLENSAREVFS